MLLTKQSSSAIQLQCRFLPLQTQDWLITRPENARTLLNYRQHWLQIPSTTSADPLICKMRVACAWNLSQMESFCPSSCTPVYRCLFVFVATRWRRPPLSYTSQHGHWAVMDSSSVLIQMNLSLPAPTLQAWWATRPLLQSLKRFCHWLQHGFRYDLANSALLPDKACHIWWLLIGYP